MSLCGKISHSKNPSPTWQHCGAAGEKPQEHGRRWLHSGAVLSHEGLLHPGQPHSAADTPPPATHPPASHDVSLSGIDSRQAGVRCNMLCLHACVQRSPPPHSSLAALLLLQQGAQAYQGAMSWSKLEYCTLHPKKLEAGSGMTSATAGPSVGRELMYEGSPCRPGARLSRPPSWGVGWGGWRGSGSSLRAPESPPQACLLLALQTWWSHPLVIRQ